MKTTNSRIETVIGLTLFCGFLAFIGFGWYGILVGGVVGALGGLYTVS